VGGIEQALFETIQHWYLTTGYLGIVLAMAIESCCIPLPSEIVMPLAGYMVFKYGDQFSLPGVAIAGAVGCVIGSAAAYAIGASGGRPLLLKYGKYVLISQADSDRADRWFSHYGAPVAFFSRLLPVIRTYISLPAGISRMNFGQFLLFTLLGSLPWTLLLAFVGFKLGDSLDHNTQLSTVFHGLDAVIAVALVVAVALYIYRHIKKDAHARNEPGAVPGQQQIRR
jgi:membrane protein DedA with SNARE-associated domain